MEHSIELIQQLSEADGVSGFEDEARAVFAERLKARGEISGDPMGNVFCEKPGSADSPRIMLDCHLDEIGFIVRHITKDGFLKFHNLGGWSGHVLAAQRVRVFAGGEKIEGIISSIPPHYMSAAQKGKALRLEDMFIDVGAQSREEAESWGIRIGSWAAPMSRFGRSKNGKMLFGKAFDNRVGCALCIETLEQAKDHPNALIASGCVQEEVGLRGATTAPHSIHPDLAIVLEGPPADDTPGFKTSESQGALGRGVQIRTFDPGMIPNATLVDLAIDTAKAKGIPYQLTVRTKGGTNAGKIHLQERGMPTMVRGVPVRYAHSHAGSICMDDYEAALNLTLALVGKMDNGLLDRI